MLIQLLLYESFNFKFDHSDHSSFRSVYFFLNCMISKLTPDSVESTPGVHASQILII